MVSSPLQFGVALLALGAVVDAQDPLRDLRRAFRAAEDPQDLFDERLAAIDALGTVDTEPAVDALLDAWQRVHGELRRTERERGRPAQQSMPSISEMRSRADLDRGLRLCSRIESRLGTARGAARSRAVDVAVSDGALPIPLRAVLAPLARDLGLAAAQLALRELRDARRPDDTWIALRVLEAVGHAAEAAGVDAVAALAHREVIVRTQAARTVAAIGHRPGVEALIARLREEDGRARDAVADALAALTGQRLGAEAAPWHAWWEAEGEAFVRGDVAPVAPAGPPVTGSRTRGAWFGIPQDGSAVLYLVDCSLSMRNRVGGKSGPTRWQECARELKQAIAQLGADRTFNVIVFAQRAVAWSDRQLPADARNVDAAARWIDGLELELGTAVFEAFEVAFALGGPHLEDRYFEPAIDTICFLSDGLPTVRRPEAPRSLAGDDPALVLALIGRRDPLRSVRVHAVMLGRAGGGAFMKRLAAASGGTFAAR